MTSLLLTCNTCNSDDVIVMSQDKSHDLEEEEEEDDEVIENLFDSQEKLKQMEKWSAYY